MRIMRDRQRRRRLREMRLLVPNARLESVQKHIAAQVGRLDPRHEDKALRWIEALSGFGKPDPRATEDLDILVKPDTRRSRHCC